MRVDPADVLLRLDPGAHLINRKTGAIRSTPIVELNWKNGNKWVRQSFVATADAPTLGAILGRIGEWLDEHATLDDALETLSKRGAS